MLTQTTDGLMGGSGFLFFIGLILVMGILFNGNGNFLGGGRGDHGYGPVPVMPFGGGFGGFGYSNQGADIMNSDYNRLLEATTENHYNTDAKFAQLQAELGRYEMESAITLLQNNNAQTQLLTNEVNSVKTMIGENTMRTMEQRINEQGQEIVALRSEKHADKLAYQQAQAMCDLRNQVTALTGVVAKEPPFVVAGGYPAVAQQVGGCDPCGSGFGYGY